MKIIKTLAILILVIGAAAAGFFWTKGNLEKEEIKGLSKVPEVSPTVKATLNYSRTLGNFLVTDKEVLKEDGKPVVYFFGSSSCPHCTWEKPIVQAVAKQFKEEIVYYENFDDQNKERDVLAKYSDINSGYVPFLILGGKYVRVGAGENLGSNEEESKKLEKEALTAIICKLTEGKPKNVCAPLKEKTAQIP